MSGRVVETVFVFDRHAATDLSVAYDILVPERGPPDRRARPGRAPVPVAGQEGRLAVTSTRNSSTTGAIPPRSAVGSTPAHDAGPVPGLDGQFELDLELGLGWAAAADRRDLRAGVVGAAEEGRDDRVADRGAARVRGRSRADCA